MSDPVRTIRLELRLDGDSPAGFARACGGWTCEFVGWIGLVAAIESVLTAEPLPGPVGTTDFSTTEGDTHDGSIPQR